MQEKRQFSNQLVNFARTLVFLVGVVMRRKLSKLKKSFTYHYRGFRNNLRSWQKIFGMIGWNLLKKREIGLYKIVG